MSHTSRPQRNARQKRLPHKLWRFSLVADLILLKSQHCFPGIFLTLFLPYAFSTTDIGKKSVIIYQIFSPLQMVRTAHIYICTSTTLHTGPFH